jgi:hypothetical protein
MIAIARYIIEDGHSRLVVPLELSPAQVIDQRDEAAYALFGIDPRKSAARWQTYLARGEEPPSWSCSDAARKSGATASSIPQGGS